MIGFKKEEEDFGCENVCWRRYIGGDTIKIEGRKRTQINKKIKTGYVFFFSSLTCVLGHFNDIST